MPDVRLEAGKSEIGNIGCKINKNKNKIILEIFDDGYGIDIDKLKHRTLSESEKQHKLSEIYSVNNLEYAPFGEGISTLDKVDEIGGRGEGMIAVINELNSLKGKLEIDTEKCKGTTLKFILPYERSEA